MLRGAGVELVERERLFTLQKAVVTDIGRYRDRAAHPAIGAIAAPRSAEPAGQFHMKAHSAAVACSADFSAIQIHPALYSSTARASDGSRIGMPSRTG